MIYDERPCSLGEGPLWHPERQELFWFDINANTLHSKAQSWRFDCTVSAAGWVDTDHLLIASDHGLHLFDITSGTLGAARIALDAENPVTRSNDGRADPWGGFWIGTMGRAAEPGAGAIYRYHRDELKVIAPDITISNAICFAPDKSHGCFTDTAAGQIMRVALDPVTGWPTGKPEVWIDLSSESFGPDGAVIDAEGNLWLAGWGAGAVIVYNPEGREIARHAVPGRHTTCPAFGGPELRDLYVTSATQWLEDETGDHGKTFVIRNAGQGQREHQVIL
ncbi:MAG: SMP-30/gluconolactonase/LRE family protein [Pseudomonadota bacterium]